MVKSVLVTGFGPFRNVPDNPTGRIVHRLVEQLRQDATLCDYRFEAKYLDVFPGVITSVLPGEEEILISLGVASGLGVGRLRIETQARNLYRDPESGILTAIDPNLPMGAALGGPPLPRNLTRPAAGFRIRIGGPTSAGDYVCNDTFFRSLRRQADSAIRPPPSYFIHTPHIRPESDGRMNNLTRALQIVIARILRHRLVDGATQARNLT